jgi:uncharacterized Tic20 family protein
MDENVEPTEQGSEDAPVSEEPQTSQPKPEVSQDAKNLAMLCHLLGLITNFLGPLILWLLKKEDDAFIDSNGKEALNFQLTVMFAMIASGILTFVCIGVLLMPVIMVLDLVFCIIACIKASNGEDYRYPLCIRLVK